MSVAKVNEIIGSSPVGFEAAAAAVIERANRTLRGITGIEVLEKRIKTDEQGILEYRVRLRLVFDMAPETVLHW
jgi:dodecin